MATELHRHVLALECKASGRHCPTQGRYNHHIYAILAQLATPTCSLIPPDTCEQGVWNVSACEVLLALAMAEKEHPFWALPAQTGSVSLRST
eukprot:CAMPEP_0180786272 /NCGR_PEP_ID=MMETSP1038_2-20121128/50706_1 /TAXON_ID=632150 /ORGANISM="Azadinium spinosum, Strain 3D9" /LENGTH=91 /DNA_ID=CAMNT_0022823371 /DNA_START=343 /DNA_END=614 /DNA_ORIENTATION=-